MPISICAIPWCRVANAIVRLTSMVSAFSPGNAVSTIVRPLQWQHGNHHLVQEARRDRGRAASMSDSRSDVVMMVGRRSS